MARRDEGGAARGHHGATPKTFASRAKPDGLFPENPPGGGSFVRGRRWLVPYSPLRGCSEFAALATAKIPRRSAPRSFQAGSEDLWVIPVIGTSRIGFSNCEASATRLPPAAFRTRPSA